MKCVMFSATPIHIYIYTHTHTVRAPPKCSLMIKYQRTALDILLVEQDGSTGVTKVGYCSLHPACLLFAHTHTQKKKNIYIYTVYIWETLLGAIFFFWSLHPVVIFFPTHTESSTEMLFYSLKVPQIKHTSYPCLTSVSSLVCPSYVNSWRWLCGRLTPSRGHVTLSLCLALGALLPCSESEDGSSFEMKKK